MAVATNADLRRTRLGASLVAQTTTERARPASPSDSSRKSTTSRPRSPTSAMTLTSASVWRAICPISVDLPTPEPANRPMRCPSPTVRSASSARTPSASGRLTRRRASGSGAGRSTGQRGGARDRARRRRSAGRARRARGRARRRRPRSRTAGRSAVHQRVGADAGRLAERHQDHLLAAEADHLGLQARALERDDLADAHAGDAGANDQAGHLGDPPRFAARRRALEARQRLPEVECSAGPRFSHGRLRSARARARRAAFRGARRRDPAASRSRSRDVPPPRRRRARAPPPGARAASAARRASTAGRSSG